MSSQLRVLTGITVAFVYFCMHLQLEAMRAARVKQEEALALMQVQSSVQTLQQMEKIKQKQEVMVRHTVTKHH